MPTAKSPIVFFDGKCNLCNRFVQFIIRHDKAKQFLFASLESEEGKKAAVNVTIRRESPPDSVILCYRGNWYTHSSAALHILKLLGRPWSLLFVCIIIPTIIRNGIYNYVSRNRYKWFGKRDQCMIPTPDIMDRFIS